MLGSPSLSPSPGFSCFASATTPLSSCLSTPPSPLSVKGKGRLACARARNRAELAVDTSSNSSSLPDKVISGTGTGGTVGTGEARALVLDSTVSENELI